MRTSNLEENYLVGSKFEPTNTGNPFKSRAHSVKTPGQHTMHHCVEQSMVHNDPL